MVQVNSETLSLANICINVFKSEFTSFVVTKKIVIGLLAQISSFVVFLLPDLVKVFSTEILVKLRPKPKIYKSLILELNNEGIDGRFIYLQTIKNWGALGKGEHQNFFFFNSANVIHLDFFDMNSVIFQEEFEKIILMNSRIIPLKHHKLLDFSIAGGFKFSILQKFVSLLCYITKM